MSGFCVTTCTNIWQTFTTHVRWIFKENLLFVWAFLPCMYIQKEVKPPCWSLSVLYFEGALGILTWKVLPLCMPGWKYPHNFNPLPLCHSYLLSVYAYSLTRSVPLPPVAPGIDSQSILLFHFVLITPSLFFFVQDKQNLKEASTMFTSTAKAPGEPEPEEAKPNKTQQLKKVFKEYGAVGVCFHIGISLMSLGMCYLLISRWQNIR